jgi:hypothetical protein
LLDNSLSHPDPERKTFRGIYMCNICSSWIVCYKANLSDVIRHISGDQHQKSII